MISKDVGCKLAGRNLGSDPVRVDLMLYGGCRFACGIVFQKPFRWLLTLGQNVPLLNVESRSLSAPICRQQCGNIGNAVPWWCQRWLCDYSEGN